MQGAEGVGARGGGAGGEGGVCVSNSIHKASDKRGRRLIN